MALNHDLEGKTYPPVRFRLEETRVRAFADAVGHRGPGVPPTIVTVPEIEAGLSNVVSDPELGVDLARSSTESRSTSGPGPPPSARS